MSLSLESRLPLRDGGSIPIVGLGTYLCSVSEARSSTAAALAIGYRHIDTAEFYNNHEGIAKGIEDSGIPREEIFITDKLNPGGAFGQVGKTFDDTCETLHTHLSRLNTSYIDLYLLHHAFAKEQRLDQYRALIHLQSLGCIKHVGVSNFGIVHLEEIRSAGLPLPVVNQIEIHPVCTQQKLLEYMSMHEIIPVAYSSLAPLGQWRIEPTQGSAKKNGVRCDEETGIIESIAARNKVSPAQVLLRWAIQKGFAILPKSSKPERVHENVDLFCFCLSEEDISLLDSLEKNQPMAWPSGNPINCD